jgi:hypothetical protein
MQSRHNIFELGNGFPTRHGTAVFLANRKLCADSFLLDMALLYFLPAGNYLRRVSWSTWHYCVSCRQETVREWFPIRLDAIVFLTGRKLFAKGFLLDMALLCFLPTGNFFAGRFLDSARNDRGGVAAMGFSTTVSGQQTADSGQSGPTKKRGPMAPLFVIPYFSDV